MATLVLSAVGSAVAGPFGLALGGLIGRQVDQAVFGGSGSHEGPRLTELSVTTSSYGQAISRQFGRMRAAGVIIWSTDLIETSEKEGGGKGRPSTTTYSYSVSFAVALSSTPISGIGRIWADGELLRGAGGDLKVAGAMRTYLGNGDNSVDPLIAADQGLDAPAFRDCAYVVFEDLALGEFGNRIPALTFEVFASNDTVVSLADLVPHEAGLESTTILEHTRGFADEGGPISGSLSAIDRVFPLTVSSRGDGIRIEARKGLPANIPELAERLSEENGTEASERQRQRFRPVHSEPIALRYYDEDRDYQPGVQRAAGKRASGSERMIDLPATMTAEGAKELASANALRSRWHHEKLAWLTGELDPEIMPGSVVKVPQHPGNWLVRSWEWYERGIEFTLERIAPDLSASHGAFSGEANTPLDQTARPTILSLFEVPTDGIANPSTPLILAAATAATGVWRGAALYVEQGDSLVPIGNSATRRATAGELATTLPASNSLLFQQNQYFEVRLASETLGLSNTDIYGLDAGSNRLLVGSEVLQFLHADALGDGMWRLSGLLRGRGGTEDFALQEHPVGTAVTLLDGELTVLNPSQIPSHQSTRIAAIGLGDPQPVFASLQNTGLSRRPPSPVHGRQSVFANGASQFSWTRRARGAWRWEDSSEIPLVEEQERYQVGYGPPTSPFKLWEVASNQFELSSATRTELVSEYGAAPLWVRQVGTFSLSASLQLAWLS